MGSATTSLPPITSHPISNGMSSSFLDGTGSLPQLLERGDRIAEGKWGQSRGDGGGTGSLTQVGRGAELVPVPRIAHGI